jgi:hypothetical protein
VTAALGRAHYTCDGCGVWSSERAAEGWIQVSLVLPGTAPWPESAKHYHSVWCLQKALGVRTQ